MPLGDVWDVAREQKVIVGSLQSLGALFTTAPVTKTADFTLADIVQAQQGRAAQLAGVADRLHAYHEEAERGDRLSPERTKELLLRLQG